MTRYAVVDIENKTLSDANAGLIATINGAALNPLTNLGLIAGRSCRLRVMVKGSVAFQPMYKRGTDQYYPLGNPASNAPTVAILAPFFFDAIVTGNDTSFDVFPGTTGNFSLTVEIDAL
jgi:hypothetical protein